MDGGVGGWLGFVGGRRSGGGRSSTSRELQESERREGTKRQQKWTGRDKREAGRQGETDPR